MTNLDHPDDVARVDVHRTRDVLAAFPQQCRQATGLAPDRPLPSARPKIVVIAGMGGSAASGDLIAACGADRVDVPIVVHRGYGLPAVATRDGLVVVTSYSGDTEEAVSALETAIDRRVPAIAVTGEGRLGRIAAQHGIPRIVVPGGLIPRVALGYLFFPTRTVLAGVGLDVADEADVTETLDELAALGRDVGPDRPTTTNPAKRLALAMRDRVPVIYGGPDTGAVAYRWKTDIEENAKIFAVSGVVPEMNHNAIEAWRAPFAGGLQMVLLRDRDESPEIVRRFTLLLDLVGAVPGGVSEAWTRGKSRLARLLALVYLGQWTSYYLALLRGVDPWSTPLLDELKHRMRTPAS
jgi:glucose/mannose-6-phosphate isomerase